MIGVAAINIPNGGEAGKITTNGLVRNINTSAWPKGTVLYPNPTTPGGLTNAVPTAPSIKTPIAFVIRQGTSNGIILVRMTTGSRLGETDSNVEFVSLADKQMIAYNGANSRWENTTNLGWDFTNSRLGVGTMTPTEKLDVVGNINVSGGITIGGDLTINGTTTTLNTRELTVDDKNIELGSVVNKTGLTATLATGTSSVILSNGNTSGVIPGQLLLKTSGVGAFETGARVGVISSATQFTVVNAAGTALNHATAGEITFSIEGASDSSASGGGITLKGTTDKTILWNNATDGWEFNQNITTTGNLSVSGSNNIGQVAGLNTRLGFEALNSLTAGDRYNTAVGYQALKLNTTGQFNSALGWQSLSKNTTGESNSALGENSMLNNTEGSFNTAVGGLNALHNNTTGSSNSAFGN